MASGQITPPPGFELDPQPKQPSTLPEGFVLDTEKPASPLPHQVAGAKYDVGMAALGGKTMEPRPKMAGSTAAHGILTKTQSGMYIPTMWKQAAEFGQRQAEPFFKVSAPYIWDQIARAMVGPPEEKPAARKELQKMPTQAAKTLLPLMVGMEGEYYPTKEGKVEAGTIFNAHARSSKAFESIGRVANDLPVDHTVALKTAQEEITDLGRRGNTVPPPVKAYIKWIEDQSQASMKPVPGQPGAMIDEPAPMSPLNYGQARDFYTSLGSAIDWNDPAYGGKGGKMNTLTKKMQHQLGEAIKDTLKPVGLKTYYEDALADSSKVHRWMEKSYGVGWLGGKLGGYAAGGAAGHPWAGGAVGSKIGPSVVGSMVRSMAGAGAVPEGAAPAAARPIVPTTPAMVAEEAEMSGRQPAAAKPIAGQVERQISDLVTRISKEKDFTARRKLIDQLYDLKGIKVSPGDIEPKVTRREAQKVEMEKAPPVGSTSPEATGRATFDVKMQAQKEALQKIGGGKPYGELSPEQKKAYMALASKLEADALKGKQ